MPLADDGDLVRRAGHLARLVAQGGAVAVVAAGDPAGAAAREQHEHAGLALVVVDAAGALDAAVARAVAAVSASAPS
ncbi:MAG: hypothetical protein AVDCRST_MAG35-1090 [uncultured Quadrisphaera sp.]|uniref:Uncharacterized protein n=1 Tax=uncultured Quadrisphaera sp. TaxID=904978 RepID=A0A6J4PAC7_9ACTN|nr:MAG: hypothetical protein AVDCRST_MAG35-1090 [uncultured Quadrisphaera sp.]